MLRTVLISVAFFGLTASAASADSFFFGVSNGPRYHQPAPVVSYWRPGPVYYTGAPVYYGQPRRFQHRYYSPRPAYVNHGHFHGGKHSNHGHGGGRGHGGHGGGHRR